MSTDNIKFALEFEKPVIELEKKITEMKEYASSTGVDLGDDIKRLEKKGRSTQERNIQQSGSLATCPARPASAKTIYDGLY